MAATTILSRYVVIPNLIEGIAFCAGIGLMPLAFIIKPSEPMAMAE